MFEESEYLPLSGLQHLRFCPRQCALIHVEQTWRDNYLTASGEVLHERVHGGKCESRGILKIERSLRISSAVLGLIGQTDVVEFYRDGRVFPVEYKRGKPKEDQIDEVQLCAQAMCLEEMLHCSITEGSLFYFRSKHRLKVELSQSLRNLTLGLALEFHEMMANGVTPSAEYSPKCESCSFIAECFPRLNNKRITVQKYLALNFETTQEE